MGIAEKLTTIAENEQKVYEAGKQEEYDAIWDVLQKNGKRTDYTGFFANGLTNGGLLIGNISPKYTIIAMNADSMFYFYPEELDLSQFLNENKNISIDFSLVIAGTHMFAYSKIVRVPEITKKGQFVAGFAEAKKLKTIDKLTVIEATSPFTNNTFQNCLELENITIGGSIDGNGMNLQWSTKLTHDSLVSIINALADKSADTSGTVWKVTVGSENLAKLTTEDLDNIQLKGWQFV